MWRIKLVFFLKKMSPNGRSLANIIWMEFILSDFRNGERKGKREREKWEKGNFYFILLKIDI